MQSLAGHMKDFEFILSALKGLRQESDVTHLIMLSWGEGGWELLIS